jgi:HSP20 family molecular chaperone IbpA
MTAMHTVGNGRTPPPHARVERSESEYLIELDVSDFTESELTVGTLGPVVTVLGDQLETEAAEGVAFRLHERLEESFRLPDDAVVDRMKAFFEHGSLELHVPRKALAPHAVRVERKPELVNPDAMPC